METHGPSQQPGGMCPSDASGASGDPGRTDALRWLGAVFNAMNEGVVVLDADARVVAYNEAALRLWGRTRDEMAQLEWPPLDRWPEVFGLLGDDGHTLTDLAHVPAFRAIRGDSVDGYRMRVRRPDGTHRRLEVRARPIPEGDGHPPGALVICTDITEQAAAEDASRVSLEKYRTLFNSSDVGISLTDEEGRVVEANAASERLLGIPTAEHIQRTIDAPTWAIVHGTGEPMRSEEFASTRALKERRTVHVENMGVRHPSGRITWLDVAATPLALPGYGVVITYTDVTARKEAEDARRTLSAAVDQSPIATIITDVHGTIEYVNPTFTATTGYSAAEAIGRKPSILKSGAQSSEFYEHMWQALTSGRVWQGEVYNRRKDGEHYWAHLRVSPLRGPDGRIQHYLGLEEDVSERKRLDQERRELWRQLAGAQKVETVGRLAGGVAHDFNNALGAILGYTDLLLREASPDGEMATQLGYVREAAQRAAELVRNLLAFARKQAIAPRTLDLNATVAHALDMLRAVVGEHIDLQWVPGDALWAVWMDPAQVDQVVTNLVLNARDAMPAGGTLSLQTRNLRVEAPLTLAPLEGRVKPGEYVCLAVRDSGGGIAETALQHIFEPFFTTKREGEGSGLGLPMVYGIIKQNDGYIGVETAHGSGTVVTVFLPRSRRGEAVEASPVGQAAPTDQATVLVVEDQPMLLQMTAAMLRRLGYTVLAARSGAEALERAGREGQRLDLLLTDVVMPGMSGVELYRALAATRTGLRVLFVSGYAAHTLRREEQVDVQSRLLTKPFTQTELATRVRQALADVQ